MNLVICHEIKFTKFVDWSQENITNIRQLTMAKKSRKCSVKHKEKNHEFNLSAARKDSEISQLVAEKNHKIYQ